MLSAIDKNDIEGPLNSLSDLNKSFECGDGPSKEDREWFKQNVGKRVVINGSENTGTVETLNESNSGFYPGQDYPI